MNEQWRDVPGFEGRYTVSSLGRVRSLLRGGRELRPGRAGNGYLTVCLTHATYPKVSFPVQWLVAAAFLGQRPPGLLVLHRDGSRTNNAASNLYYGTYSENLHDRARHGGRKFTPDQIREMRRLMAAGHRPKSVAARFGVNHSCIYKIRNMDSYTSV